MRSSGKLTVTGIFLLLMFATAVYGCVLYVPIFWNIGELESLIKEHSYSAKSKTSEALRDAIIADAVQKLSIWLEPEDVIVDRLGDRVKIDAIWRVTVELPFNRVLRHAFGVERETIFY